MSILDLEVEGLLNKIFEGEIDSCSEDEKALLLELTPLLSQEILMVLSEATDALLNGECFDAEILYGGLKLAAFLRDSQAFEWIRKLCYVSTEIIDDLMGEQFVCEELKNILAATAHHQWPQLKEEIEDPSLDEFVRGACLDALVIMGAEGKIERQEIIQYFHQLFQLLINEELHDEALASMLVFSCIEFWPGECLEEIKKLFELQLVDTDFVDIETVFRAFKRGKLACLEKLKKNFEIMCSLKHSLTAEEDFEDIAHSFYDPGRNDPCPCNSGQKYKKCCLKTTLPALL